MVKIEESKTKGEIANLQDKKRNLMTASNNKFNGRSGELKGCMIDTDPRNVDRYIICKEEIDQHVGASFDHGDLITSAI
eukprot:1979329-Ditylum_brightwellii.AAC.2